MFTYPEEPVYPSRRSVAVGRQAMVATTQPLAVQHGLAMLRAGGTAVDAALAAAATLLVTEPHSNGLGGDAFALVWDGRKLHGLNGSGRAPAAISVEAVRSAGHESMPHAGWLCATIPGAPRAWEDLHQRFGRLPLAQVFGGAIEAAEHGFAVPEETAIQWSRSAHRILNARGPGVEAFARTFCRDGRGPAPAEVFRHPAMAATLKRLVDAGIGDFYHGDIAARMIAFCGQTGGLWTARDLADHTSTWVDPISTNYRGYDVWEIPPNGQGIGSLMALNILEGFDLASLGRECAESYHLAAEAMKLAFADMARYVADPEHAQVPVEWLLSKDYAAQRRALISREAGNPPPGSPPRGGTVYLCTADAAGMMVSFIQSTYEGFGSGVTVPDTGIYMQNRGANFTLDDGHPNRLAPGKRPYHTIIPGFLTRAGKAVGPFGVMGGFMQPQGHVQMMLNTIDWNLHPQASLDAPRWRVADGRRLAVESHCPAPILDELRARGHDLSVLPRGGGFGGGQIIWRTDEGVYLGGSDPRRDGLALGF